MKSWETIEKKYTLVQNISYVIVDLLESIFSKEHIYVMITTQ